MKVCSFWDYHIKSCYMCIKWKPSLFHCSRLSILKPRLLDSPEGIREWIRKPYGNIWRKNQKIPPKPFYCDRFEAIPVICWTLKFGVPNFPLTSMILPHFCCYLWKIKLYLFDSISRPHAFKSRDNILMHLLFV